MRASEFITETGKRIDRDTIDLIKILWDEGKTPTAIANYLSFPTSKVRNILLTYYPNRPGKLLKIASALTDDDKNTIVSRFVDQNATAADIGQDYGIDRTTVIEILKNKLGVDRYNTILALRRQLSGTRLNNKITPEMLDKIKELYAAGSTLRDISAYFDNTINHNTVHRSMVNQPDYHELRAKRDERIRKIKHSPVATTTIHRPGIIDPQKRKGPNSSQRSGVNWPKYGE